MPRSDSKKARRRAREQAMASRKRDTEVAAPERGTEVAAPRWETEGSSNGDLGSDAVTSEHDLATATALLAPRSWLPDYGDDVEAVDGERSGASIARRATHDVEAVDDGRSGASIARRATPDYGDDVEAVDDERFGAAIAYEAAPTARTALGEDVFYWPRAPTAPRDRPADRREAPISDADPDGGDVPVRSETESAMRGLFGRDGAYLLVAASQAGLAALSIPITTRLLGSGFAVITLSLAVMQLLVAVGVFSLSTAIQRNYRISDGGRDARRTVTLAIITATVTCAVASATGPVWAPALSHGRFSPALQYAVIWAALTSVTFASIALIRSRNLLRVYALISVIQSFVAEVFSVLLVVFVHRSAAEFVFGEMLMQAVAATIAVAVARPLMLRRRDRDLIVRSLKYSSALVPAAVSGFLLTTCDRLIIRHDLPILQLARYGAVYNVASIPLLLLGMLDQVWLPRFLAIDDARVRGALLADSRDALYRILIPVILGIGFGIPLVLAVWIPHDYHAAGLVIVVLTISAGSIPMAGYISANRVLLISGRTLPVGLCMVLAATLNIGANIALVPVLGIEGSALSTSLAFLLLQILTTVFAHRVQRLRHPPLELLALSAAAVGVAFSCTALPASGVFAVARALLTLGCVATVIVLLRGLVSPSNAPRLAGRALKRR
jgi:O-antigen/teichoic acid export membrane protein